LPGVILRLYKFFKKITGNLLCLDNLTFNIFAKLLYTVLGWPAASQPLTPLLGELHLALFPVRFLSF